MENTNNNNDNTLLWNDLVAGKPIKFDGSLKTGVLLKLHELFSKSTGQTEDAKKELLDIIEYLNRHLIAIKKITPIQTSKKNGVLFKYDYDYRLCDGETEEQVIKGVNDRLVSAAVTWAVADMTGRGPEFIKFLIKAEGEIKKQQQRTRIKHGPEITEQILRRPAQLQTQPTLWDTLDTEAKTALVQQHNNDKQTAITYINRKGQGINLSEDEEKMIDVIQELLHEKSQNRDERRDDYFIGNPEADTADAGKTPVYAEGKIKDAHLLITVTEAARKFSGQHRPGGREQETARRIINEIGTNPDKQCLMQYHIPGDAGIKVKGRRKKVTKTTISEYAALWTIVKIEQTMEDGGKAGDLYLKLHPIFRARIEELAILMPTLEARYAAYGSSKMPKAVRRFLLSLAEAHKHIGTKTKSGTGTRLHEVGQIKLFEQIAPDYNKPGKMKRVQLTKKQLTKGIEAAKKLGMIAGATTRTNPEGEVIYIFELVEGWRTGGNMEP